MSESWIGKLSNYITTGLTNFFIDLGNAIGDGLYDAWELATDFWDENIAPIFTKMQYAILSNPKFTCIIIYYEAGINARSLTDFQRFC